MIKAERPGESKAPSQARWSEACEVFDALAHPARLAVFLYILRAGESGAATEALRRALGTTGCAVSLHLRSLARIGLIRSRRGRNGMVFADWGRIEAVQQLLVSEWGVAALGSK